MTDTSKREELVDGLVEVLIEMTSYTNRNIDEITADPNQATYGDWAERLISVFEQAHAPTDDERIVRDARDAADDLTTVIRRLGRDVHDHNFMARTVRAEALLRRIAAGFRRTAVQEPQGEPPCCDVSGGPERCGDCPLDRGSEPQSEPTDAQEAVRRLKEAGVGAFMILAAVTKVYDMETKGENR